MARACVFVALLFVACWWGCEGAPTPTTTTTDDDKQLEQLAAKDGFDSLGKRDSSDENSFQEDWNKPLMFGRLRMPMYYSPDYGKRAYQPRHPAQLARARQLMRIASNKRQSQLPPEVDINLPLRFGKRYDSSGEGPDGVKRNQFTSEMDLNLPLRFGKRADKHR